MKNLARYLAIPAALVVSALAAEAQIIVYDNLDTTPAAAGYSEPASNNPIFGDALNLTQSGKLSFFGFNLYNATTGGNTGSMLGGTMVLKFYDNNPAYSAGSLSAGRTLLGTATVTLDFTSFGGLPAGFYDTELYDFTSLNINLTQNIFVTQAFTQTSGTSTRNGIVLFGNPTIGSSPNNVYINSSGTPEGLYNFGTTPAQIGYHVEVVPEPGTFAIAGLGLAGLVVLRRRNK